jgi:PAS domain S-box-containing protein
MKDERKTKAQLLAELADLRTHAAELELRHTESVSAKGALLESASAAIIIADSAGRIVLVNAGAEQMFGYTRDELVGQMLEMLLPERSTGKHVAQRDYFFAHPRVRPMGQGLELAGRRKDGTTFPIEVGLSYTQTEAGLLAMSFIIDVTERKRGEAQMRLMERAMAAATNGIIITDTRQPDLPIIYANPAFERITGYTREEVVGLNCRFLQRDDRDQPALNQLRQALREGRSCQVILRNYRKDGTLFWNELDLAPVNDEHGRLTHYVGVQNDITERRRSEEELARKNRELDAALVAAEAATQAKSEFLANMSHEIRTPLNAIIGMTGLLLDAALDPDQRDYAETVRASSESLLSIINDILDFSKIEASKLELEQQPFSLIACLEESLDLLASNAATKDLELGYLVDPGVPATLVGDVTRLRQILVNLLSNAVKFTDHGEVVLTVTIENTEPRIQSTESTQSTARPREAPGTQHLTLHFAVRDTGIGIPPERAERLFQPFSQLDASMTRRFGGTGLGLAISKRLIELMGGRIWVESAGVPGQGTTFHFTIEAHLADQRDATTPAPRTELTGLRALIVDDNATNRLILMRQIQPWGMTSREAAAGAEALEWVRQGEHFDIAILDLRMPGMDGLTLAAELRKLRPELPLVMLTSMGRREAGLEELSVAAFLTKPIKPAQLYRVMTEALGMGARRPLAPHAAAPPLLDGHMALRHPLRILLAEDNIVNQKVAVRILERLGYRADVVANGLEVLGALRRQRYDVVLMDVQMPEMDGLEAARQIVARWPRDQRPHLIAMTAYALEGDRERCIAAGMDDYISKPVRVEELAERLMQAPPAAPLASRPRRESAASSVPAAQLASQLAPQAALEPATLDPLMLDNLRVALRDEIADVIDVFLDNTPKVLAELRRAVEQGDGQAMEQAAHSLKSSSATFGAAEFSQHCKELEILGRAGQMDGVAARLQHVEAEYERMKLALQAEQRRVRKPR